MIYIHILLGFNLISDITELLLLLLLLSTWFHVLPLLPAYSVTGLGRIWKVILFALLGHCVLHTYPTFHLELAINFLVGKML